LELQKMNWAGPKPKNRGEFRDIWERHRRNNGQPYNMKIDLYHMTSIKNLKSILTHGLLSEYEIKNLGIVPDHISNHKIVKKRTSKQVVGNTTISHYALLYFQPRNAMLYKIIKGNSVKQKIIILRFSYDVSNGGFFTTKNALLANTFYRLDDINNRPILEENMKLIEKKYWNNYNEMIEMMAESLIYQKLELKYLCEIFYLNQSLSNVIRQTLTQMPSVQISHNKEMFFE